MAIRRNCESVEKIKDAISATYYHYSSTDKKPQHGQESQNLKVFQLVLFKKIAENESENEDQETVNQLQGPLQKKIDIVPGFWPQFDIKLGTLVTPFLPEPMKESDIKLLHKLVKNCSEPLSIWPVYPIELIGHASTILIIF